MTKNVIHTMNKITANRQIKRFFCQRWLLNYLPDDGFFNNFTMLLNKNKLSRDMRIASPYLDVSYTSNALCQVSTIKVQAFFLRFFLGFFKSVRASDYVSRYPLEQKELKELSETQQKWSIPSCY